MPGRFIDAETAYKIVDEFLQTPFEGGRHIQRVADIPLK
jgi:ribose 5-phosphate isomerase B